ncbi:MAG: serine/threonine-protein kinase, partial [Planctomycetota bacterium]
MSSTQSIEELFQQLIEIPTTERRSEFLDRVCGDDLDLRRQLEGLARCHEQAGSFLQDDSLDDTQDPGVQPTTTGQSIGPYKLRELVGEGGMGSVYVAEQEKPVKRHVALKVIKPGMDTKEVVARFEAERQALAMMDHPSIAKVFDAGMTDNGGPFFVMELINGVPITDYCDDNKLGIRERLELFVQVCKAVQHAHQKGVIHRDIKPSNVLVTLHDGDPVPVIIDFGVAKATNQNLTEQTIYTRLNQVVGTTLYMSPEQAELSRYGVDTRTDIYSLGVLLYELLTGTTPFDRNRLNTAAFDEVRRIIREEEPPKPSTRISSLGETATEVSTHRNTEPARLTSAVLGDLDWIVMTALEKDRSRRYDSAKSFADDIENHLDDRAVEARPPSAVYRLQKVWKRNRIVLSTVSGVFLALVIGLGMAFTAITQKNRALEELGESAMQHALQAALKDNREETDKWLQIAKNTGIAPERIELVDLCLKLYSKGEFPSAFARLQDVIRQNDSIAAHALAANAALWAGNDLDLHYQKVIQVDEQIADIRDRHDIELETRVFLGQAIGIVRPNIGLEILRPAVEKTNSPVTRTLFAQALLELSFDTDDPEDLAREAFHNASAAYHFMPESSMPKAIYMVALHAAWIANVDNQREWYLMEAKRLYDGIDPEEEGPIHLFAAHFFAEANDKHISLAQRWIMVENDTIDPGVPGHLYWCEPSRYDDLIEILESRLQGDSEGWAGAENALLVLRALDRKRHQQNRDHIKNLDRSVNRLWGLDPRFFALAAALIMEGRNGETTVDLLDALGSRRVPSVREPIRLLDYLKGEITEPEFLAVNDTGKGRRTMSEFYVALTYLGDGKRKL